MTALAHQIDGPAEAPALLLGPSLGTSFDLWEEQMPLSRSLRLVRFDHRGHGRSPVPPGPYGIADLGRDVLELMDDLEVRRAHYCGVSLGGMVGMWLAAHAPERIERLILICTAAQMPPASAWRERACVVRDAGSTAPIADTVVDRWLTPGFAAAHPEVREQLREMLLASPAAGYAACCGAIERLDLRAELPRIQAPTLIISGAGDLATPPDRQAEIAAAIPGARHEIADPGAHIVPVERPDFVNGLMERFLL